MSDSTPNDGATPEAEIALELATVEQLIDELGKRSVGLVVVYERAMPGSTESTLTGSQCHWRKCGPIGALGLLRFADKDIWEGIKNTRGPMITE
jgi:hypothetical protein